MLPKAPDFAALSSVQRCFAGTGFSTYATAQEWTYLLDLNNRTATEWGRGLGGEMNHPTAINDSRQVVGWLYTAEGSQHAFITGPKGVGHQEDVLGTLGGARSVAWDINNSGQVTGLSTTARDDSDHAFITGPDGLGMKDLGTLSGYSSEARAINDAGQVTGSFVERRLDPFAHFYSYIGYPFITGPNGTDIRRIDTRQNGPWPWAEPFAINLCRAGRRRCRRSSCPCFYHWAQWGRHAGHW